MSNNSTKYDSIATIALDLSKNYIQIHAEDAGRRQVMNRRFGTSEARKFLLKLHPCEVGMEACATAHSWGRLLQKHGMTVHLIPGQYVKPYVTRSKTDALDARAVAEAMRRSDLTFVPVKSEPQQALQTVHKTREALVTQRTATINAMRAHCAEFGVYTAVGRSGFNKLVTLVEDADFFDWPAPLVKSLKIQIDQVHELDEQILELEKELEAHARGCEDCQRLLAIGGVGGWRCQPVPQRASAGGLSGSDAERAFDRWPTASGRNLQARHLVCAPAADPRTVVGLPKVSARSGKRTGCDAPHAQARQFETEGGGGRRQPHGAGDLGGSSLSGEVPGRSHLGAAFRGDDVRRIDRVTDTVNRSRRRVTDRREHSDDVTG